MLPPPIKIDLSDRVQTLWSERVIQHLLDSYAGLPLLKFPEDLRVYEHLLWETRSNVVIELGSHSGGSALWFRDRLRTLESYGRIRDPRVISVDVDIQVAQEAVGRIDPNFDLLTLLEANVLDESLPGLVERHLPADAVCLVVEDSAHTRETTTAALRGFSRFVRPGGFFVVEDGCVDVEEMRQIRTGLAVSFRRYRTFCRAPSAQNSSRERISRSTASLVT